MSQEPDELDAEQGSDDDFLDADDPGRSDYHERMLERADYLRDKMRDEAWERSLETLAAVKGDKP